MHVLSLCFISAACFSAFYTNTENSKFLLTLVLLGKKQRLLKEKLSSYKLIDLLPGR